MCCIKNVSPWLIFFFFFYHQNTWKSPRFQIHSLSYKIHLNSYFAQIWIVNMLPEPGFRWSALENVSSMTKSQFVWWLAVLHFIKTQFIILCRKRCINWVSLTDFTRTHSCEEIISLVYLGHSALMPNTRFFSSCQGLCYSQTTCYPAIPGVCVLKHVVF